MAPIEADGATREEVEQTAARLLPTAPTEGAEVPLHPGILTPFEVKLTVPVAIIGSPGGAITAFKVSGISTIGDDVLTDNVTVELNGVSVTEVVAGAATVKLPFVSV